MAVALASVTVRLPPTVSSQAEPLTPGFKNHTAVRGPLPPCRIIKPRAPEFTFEGLTVPQSWACGVRDSVAPEPLSLPRLCCICQAAPSDKVFSK